MAFVQITLKKNSGFSDIDANKIKSGFSDIKISKSKALKELGKQFGYSGTKTSDALSNNFILAFEHHDNIHVLVKGLPGEWDIFCITKSIKDSFKSFFEIIKKFQEILEEIIYSSHVEPDIEESKIRKILNDQLITGLICFLIPFIITGILPQVNFLLIAIIIIIIIFILGILRWLDVGKRK